MRKLPALLLLAALGAVPPAGQEIEEEEDLLARVREMGILLNIGAVAFDELDFTRAVRDLSRIVDPYRSGRLEPATPEETGILARALELRGRAFFNLGQIERADADFEELIRLQVDYRLDREKISPKVIRRWEEVRRRLVGKVNVRVEPFGAEVWIDGAPAGLGPRLERDVLAGPHTLRVVHPGYAAVEERFESLAGEVVDREVELQRNARDVRFFTVPSGVEVRVDGEPVGTTTGMAPPEYAEMADRISIPRERISAPLLVRNLAPGDHRISFRRECHAPAAVRIEVVLDSGADVPQDFRPVVLEPSVATIRVRGPAGAELRIDGTAAGRVPFELDGICSGEHFLEAATGAGALWFEAITLEKDERREIRVSPRPTLVYLGLFSRRPGGEVRIANGGPLLDRLRAGGAFNLIGGAGYAPDGEGKEGRPRAVVEFGRRFAFLQSTVSDTLERAGLSVWTSDGPADAPILARARERLRADLVLLGAVPRGGGEVFLFLYETEVARPDRIVVPDPLDEDSWRRIAARLAKPTDLFVPRFGATAADTFLTEAPVLVRVSEGGPAARAGLRPGDEVVAAAGRPVRTARELERAYRTSGGDPLPVKVRRDGEERDLEVGIGLTPRLIPLFDEEMLYARMIAEFRLRARTARSSRERNLVHLNLGLAYLHFGEYERAIEEGFRRVELDSGPGISAGTVQYYLGVCYRELGRSSRARDAWRRAAGDGRATLETDDGPLVARRAERLLRSLD